MLKRKYDQIENDEEELKFAKICSENEKHEFQRKKIKTRKSDTKTITIKKAKAMTKKRERSQKASKDRWESRDQRRENRMSSGQEE